MSISEDEFKRLPQDVQQGIREKERDERTLALAYQQRLKKREVEGAAFAGISTMVVTAFLSDGIAFPMAVGFVCAIAGALTVRLQFKALGGVMLVGGTATLANAIGSGVGWCAPVFFAWVIFPAIGALVGSFADGSRGREDSGF
ncbi:MAG: hypothetical protein WCT04_15785 [Planctomycetota bacterium]